MFQKIQKNVKFGFHNWCHHEERIQTNEKMPRICSIIYEIDFEMENIWREQIQDGKTNG